jgi:hypothetical protein
MLFLFLFQKIKRKKDLIMRDYERKFLDFIHQPKDFNYLGLYESYEFLKEKGLKIRKIKSYLNKQLEAKKENKNWFGEEMGVKIENVADMFYLFRRYHKAAQKLAEMKGNKYIVNGEEDLYPEDIFTKYNCINDEIIALDNIKEKYSDAIQKFLKWETEFEVDGIKYYATVPRTQKELIMEGYNLHNCLVMRGPYVASGEMKVVFIRKEDNKPFMDVILDENDRIIWAITDFHANVKWKEENYAITKAWYRLAVENVKYDRDMWIPMCFC